MKSDDDACVCCKAIALPPPPFLGCSRLRQVSLPFSCIDYIFMFLSKKKKREKKRKNKKKEKEQRRRFIGLSLGYFLTFRLLEYLSGRP